MGLLPPVHGERDEHLHQPDHGDHPPGGHRRLLTGDAARGRERDTARHTAGPAPLPALRQVGAYALSFLVLAAFWRDHHRLFLGVRQVDGLVIRLTLFGLGVAALLPFPTSLIAEYGREPSAVAIYSAAVAVLGSIQFTLLLVVWKRPWLRAAPLPDREAHAYLADLGATVAVFAATAPLSFLLGSRVVWGWLLLLPVKFVIGRWSTRVSRSDV
ncbi:TMEM175 family protein [Streptomyces sp. XY431]|uniref:TMEM175 family protein n=1 Tax=Streptomyces sp. XY431 TaxID=1415562 RepID=UPI00099B761A|nr:TMEM175 family protein [Streptomyces sp. XY431]